MPEMLQYCGRRFQVYRRAHKTCDYSKDMESRRVANAVHLEGLRCTGEAHGGCQAECLLFWNEAWLQPADGARPAPPARATTAGACSVEDLHRVTVDAREPAPIYSCQATRIPRFSTPLRTGELDQYVEAYVSGNVRTIRSMIPPLLFRIYTRLVYSRLGGTGIPQRVYDAFQRLRGGIPFPNRPGSIPPGQKTPRGVPLNLEPGELVRVKSFAEILTTIDGTGKNRGLLFSQEMVPFCGQTFRVHSRVSQIIDEKTGRMLRFSNDCIILEGVVCQGRYNAGLSFCPRANYPYWREIWLERIPAGETSPAPACAVKHAADTGVCSDPRGI
jgi:hypothetical protein